MLLKLADNNALLAHYRFMESENVGRELEKERQISCGPVQRSLRTQWAQKTPLPHLGCEGEYFG